MESENPPNQSPYSRKNRPAPLILGLDHPAAPPPSPKELSRKGPPSLPLNPLPTPRRTAVFHDSTRWTAEEAGNLALACQSGVPLGWDEIAQLFPGKSPMSCREKFLKIEQLEAEKDSSLAPFDGDLESLPALSRGPSLVSSPMVEKQPQELRYWIAPEHCKSPKQKEEDISAWFRGIDVMDIEQDSQSYPLA